VVAPLFHILACGMQWIPALACGGTAVIAPAFEAGGWLRAIRDERIDVLNGVPAMYWQALRHPRVPRSRCVRCPAAELRGRADAPGPSPSAA
jgi:acyl-CoA synthetase (AMP-forming)/AMP-acid ligase II